MSQKEKVGFIGLGIMGLAMAKNAKAAGYEVRAYNRSAAGRDRAMDEKLDVLSTPKEVADHADVLVVMVTGPQAVQEVLLGPSGVLAGSVKGKTLIQMSTIDEKSTLQLAEACQSQNMKFLDCPVAGSKKQVEAAQLILLAGGDTALLDQWRDLLLSLGKAIVHAGAVGKGSALKLCMNLIVAQMTTALCESVALARVQDVDPQKIFDVIRESPAINCGYYQIKEKALLSPDYSPAFSLENMLKDVRFMDEAAKTHRLALPVNQAVRFLMEATASEGHGPKDLSVMAEVLKPKVGG